MNDPALSMEELRDAQRANERDACIPIFHYKVVVDDEVTEKTGRRSYKEVPYVKVISPGNDKEIPDFRVTKSHKDRWPVQWRAFTEKREAPLDGIPLDKWSGITPVEIKMLEDEGIRTVESFVKVPDSNLQNIGGAFLGLKSRAEAFLSSLEGEAGYQKMKKENDELKDQVDTLKGQIVGLEKRIDELLTVKKGK